MMLAQLSGASADHIKDFAVIGIAISMPIISIAALAIGRKTRIEPDPLRVQKVEGLVTKVECERAHSSVHDALASRQAIEDKIHDQLFAKVNAVDRRQTEQINILRTEMHGMELRINATAEERATKVHDRVNEILAAENETRGTISMLSKNVSDLAQEVRSR